MARLKSCPDASWPSKGILQQPETFPLNLFLQEAPGAPGVRGRGTDTKFIVVIAIEVLSPKGFGRVRLQRVDDVSGASLIPFYYGGG
jgi:hypothetical protein